MAKTSVASILAASAFALKAQAQVYTESVATAPSASSELVTYTVTENTGASLPLYQKVFDYPYLPYQADTSDGARGTQQGYNICNSTTEGPDSMCQTAFANTIDDFCIWGAPGTAGQPLEIVADVEGEMVAYCTTNRHGARVLPAGTLQGVQYIKTPDYVEIIGTIDQTQIHLQANDSGGEEDPHGADMRGNPLGSLFYSSAFGPGNYSAYQQIHEWHYFVGGGIFCLKVCDPASPNGAELCQHIYDRIGCAYNVPADYGSLNGTFSSCLGEDQLPPGVYVTNGQTMTYSQPPESLGPITSIPYTASIPPSSQCSSYTSSSLYTEMAGGSKSASAASSMATDASMSRGSAVASDARAAAAAKTSSPSTSQVPTSSAERVMASAAFGIVALIGMLVMA